MNYSVHIEVQVVKLDIVRIRERRIFINVLSRCLVNSLKVEKYSDKAFRPAK